ncbi:uncharacterized protein L969DRAFT_260657 [Mixia osmundae IAM 14324]|uniref:uncharacterized protein n=1 Tax=Mixia osmundae (strain CBS 9802 / IAM 14324 / JCM 22182 / KY 12970) TaxID=764103 RepID=UPI0004A55563|nr:uncharacterized protein L969DRAFT_260657 [Mixia osmundae IAM 14324]KEI36522.1 hypothetical protein L969DRAFT_260657 [Mixia osmundae IAM 14324]
MLPDSARLHVLGLLWLFAGSHTAWATALQERKPLARRNYCNRLTECVVICEEIDIGWSLPPGKMIGMLPFDLAEIFIDVRPEKFKNNIVYCTDQTRLSGVDCTAFVAQGFPDEVAFRVMQDIPLEAVNEPVGAAQILSHCCKIFATIDVNVGFTRRFWRFRSISSYVLCDWQILEDAQRRTDCAGWIPNRSEQDGCLVKGSLMIAHTGTRAICAIEAGSCQVQQFTVSGSRCSKTRIYDD